MGRGPQGLRNAEAGQRAPASSPLIDFARERLAHFKCPKTVAFGELPKTATGKIQKYKLREQEWAGRREADPGLRAADRDSQPHTSGRSRRARRSPARSCSGPWPGRIEPGWFVLADGARRRRRRSRSCTAWRKAPPPTRRDPRRATTSSAGSSRPWPTATTARGSRTEDSSTSIPAAAKILGYSSVEALMERRTIDLYASPEDRAPIIEQIQQHGEFRGVEIRLRRQRRRASITGMVSGRILHDEAGRAGRARGELLRRHGPEGDGGGPRGGQAPRRAGEPRQEHLPRQHEPRAADADERDHRLQRDIDGGRRGRGQRLRGRRPPQDPRRQHAPAGAHQRHPRPLEGRGGQDGGPPRDLRGRDARRRGRVDRGHADGEERKPSDRRGRPRPDTDARGPHQGPAGAPQPAEQRRQVQPRGRGEPHGAAGGRGRRRARADGGGGFGHRDSAGEARPRVRGVLPGRRHHDSELRRDGPGPPHQPALLPDDGGRPHGGEPGRRGLRLHHPAAPRTRPRGDDSGWSRRPRSRRRPTANARSW